MQTHSNSSLFLLGTLLLLGNGPCFAQNYGTKAEAEALVKKTVGNLKTEGRDKVLAAITTKAPAYVERDLYPVVYDLNGLCLAHGANPKLVGRDLIDLQDIDGVAFVRERIEKAKTTSSFWQSYKYANPVSKKIEAKEAFCEKREEMIVCAGAYTSVKESESEKR